MNILQARAKYEDACKVTNGQAPFEDLVGMLIDSGYHEPFKNDSYFDALWLTHHMLNRTYKTICMMTGCGAEGFFAALREPFEGALKRIAGCGGSVRAVLLNPAGHTFPFLGEMAAKYPEVFQYRFGNVSGPIGHFLVCDGKMTRIEEPHSEIEDASAASVIKATVNFNDPLRAGERETFFKVVWDKVASVSKSKKAS